MKKITLMAATVISTATLAGTSMTASAACKQNANINSNRIKVIQVDQSCDLDSLLSQLKNCLPGIQFPQIQQPCQPGTSTPDTNLPTPELPEVETPSPELPDQDVSTPEIPDQDTSTPELPDNSTPETETPAPEQNHSYVQQIVNLVNEERAKEGLAPLTLDTKVSAAAQVRAQEIVTSFSHTRPDGASFATALKEQNISYRRAGENIAWGQKSPEAVMNAWMNSSGHRANIMNENFTTIGVGYYQVNGVNYWCQLFTA